MEDVIDIKDIVYMLKSICIYFVYATETPSLNTTHVLPYIYVQNINVVIDKL